MKGICFIEPLFEKVVNGAKTQTRCIAAHLPAGSAAAALPGVPPEPCRHPRYKVGETLYLKEPYAVGAWGSEAAYRYLAPGSELGGGMSNLRFCSKLLMPKRYARYFIKITAVRVERLQDISLWDCIAEGVCCVRKCTPYVLAFYYTNGATMDGSGNLYGYATARDAYAALIDHINDKGTWASNPWVFVYNFCLLEEKR